MPVTVLVIERVVLSSYKFSSLSVSCFHDGIYCMAVMAVGSRRGRGRGDVDCHLVVCLVA